MIFPFPPAIPGPPLRGRLCCSSIKSKLRIPALIIAVLIGFSRLYLYVHYPTDVLAGAVLGVLLGWVGCALVSRVENCRAVQERG